MKLYVLSALAACVAPATILAQVEDACPDRADDKSILAGLVQDPQLPGVPLAGATVAVWWETDDDRESAETLVGEDGIYVVCDLPRDVVIFTQASFAGREGAVEALRLSEPSVRLDLLVSLADEDESRPRAFPIVMDGSGRCPELMAPSVARCVDFTNCNTVRMGRVRARRVGAGDDTRATVEQLIEQARRLGAHAVENLEAYWEEDAFRPVLVRLEGTAVEFTDDRCRRLAGVSG